MRDDDGDEPQFNLIKYNVNCSRSAVAKAVNWLVIIEQIHTTHEFLLITLDVNNIAITVIGCDRLKSSVFTARHSVEFLSNLLPNTTQNCVRSTLALSVD